MEVQCNSQLEVSHILEGGDGGSKRNTFILFEKFKVFGRTDSERISDPEILEMFRDLPQPYILGRFHNTENGTNVISLHGYQHKSYCLRLRSNEKQTCLGDA